MLLTLAPITVTKLWSLKSSICNNIDRRLPITETIQEASLLDPSLKEIMLKQLGENSSQHLLQSKTKDIFRKYSDIDKQGQEQPDPSSRALCVPLQSGENA